MNQEIKTTWTGDATGATQAADKVNKSVQQTTKSAKELSEQLKKSFAAGRIDTAALNDLTRMAEQTNKLKGTLTGEMGGKQMGQLAGHAARLAGYTQAINPQMASVLAATTAMYDIFDKMNKPVGEVFGKLNTMKGALTAVGGAVGVVGAAFAGWSLGKQLDELLGIGKAIDEMTANKGGVSVRGMFRGLNDIDWKDIGKIDIDKIDMSKFINSLSQDAIKELKNFKPFKDSPLLSDASKNQTIGDFAKELKNFGSYMENRSKYTSITSQFQTEYGDINESRQGAIERVRGEMLEELVSTFSIDWTKLKSASSDIGKINLFDELTKNIAKNMETMPNIESSFGERFANAYKKSIDDVRGKLKEKVSDTKEKETLDLVLAPFFKTIGEGYKNFVEKQAGKRLKPLIAGTESEIDIAKQEDPLQKKLMEIEAKYKELKDKLKGEQFNPEYNTAMVALKELEAQEKLNVEKEHQKKLDEERVKKQEELNKKALDEYNAQQKITEEYNKRIEAEKELNKTIKSLATEALSLLGREKEAKMQTINDEAQYEIDKQNQVIDEIAKKKKEALDDSMSLMERSDAEQEIDDMAETEKARVKNVINALRDAKLLKIANEDAVKPFAHMSGYGSGVLKSIGKIPFEDIGDLSDKIKEQSDKDVKTNKETERLLNIIAQNTENTITLKMD